MVRKSPIEHDLPGLRLLVIRHGKAERQAPSGKDEDRALKPRGERQAEWLGEYLRTEHVLPALILHSPVLRAVQTARTLHARTKSPLQQVMALALGEPVRGVVHLVSSYRGMGTLALVGHNPQLSTLAAAMVPDLDEHDVDLRTGECLVLDVAPGVDVTSAMLTDRWRLEEDEED
jgi:phosphohistidine phosphatase